MNGQLPLIDNAGGRRIVHGTPITPVRLLDTLAGGSFCVSFANPEQLDRCIDLVGEDEVLILDNGAFTHWRAGHGRVDRYAFWDWANAAQARCPNAIAVIPDVIEGDEQDNLAEMSWALREGLSEYPERTMSVWHLDESFDFLTTQARIMNFVAIGSTNTIDVQRHKQAYLNRLADVYTVITAAEHVHGADRPWIHLLRGLGIYHRVAWADSADSCNVAINHCRHRHLGDARAAAMHDRIDETVQAAASVIPLA